MFQSNFNVDSLGQAVTNICAHTKLHIYVYHRKLNGNFIKESCRDLCLFFHWVRLCWFCVDTRFFILTITANDLQLQRISILDVIHSLFVLFLILEKEAVFPI